MAFIGRGRQLPATGAVLQALLLLAGNLLGAAGASSGVGEDRAPCNIPDFGPGVAHTCGDKAVGSYCWTYCKQGFSGQPAQYVCIRPTGHGSSSGGTLLTPTFVAVGDAVSCRASHPRPASGVGPAAAVSSPVQEATQHASQEEQDASRQHTAGCGADAVAQAGLSVEGLWHNCLGIESGSLCTVLCDVGYSGDRREYAQRRCQDGVLVPYSGTTPQCFQDKHTGENGSPEVVSVSGQAYIPAKVGQSSQRSVSTTQRPTSTRVAQTSARTTSATIASSKLSMHMQTANGDELSTAAFKGELWLAVTDASKFMSAWEQNSLNFAQALTEGIANAMGVDDEYVDISSLRCISEDCKLAKSSKVAVDYVVSMPSELAVNFGALADPTLATAADSSMRRRLTEALRDNADLLGLDDNAIRFEVVASRKVNTAGLEDGTRVVSGPVKASLGEGFESTWTVNVAGLALACCTIALAAAICLKPNGSSCPAKFEVVGKKSQQAMGHRKDDIVWDQAPPTDPPHAQANHRDDRCRNAAAAVAARRLAAGAAATAASVAANGTLAQGATPVSCPSPSGADSPRSTMSHETEGTSTDAASMHSATPRPVELRERANDALVESDVPPPQSSQGNVPLKS